MGVRRPRAARRANGDARPASGAARASWTSSKDPRASRNGNRRHPKTDGDCRPSAAGAAGPTLPRLPHAAGRRLPAPQPSRGLDSPPGPMARQPQQIRQPSRSSRNAAGARTRPATAPMHQAAQATATATPSQPRPPAAVVQLLDRRQRQRPGHQQADQSQSTRVVPSEAATSTIEGEGHGRPLRSRPFRRTSGSPGCRSCRRSRTNWIWRHRSASAAPRWRSSPGRTPDPG